MNSKELKVQMIRKNKSVDELCATIGISRSAWFRKVGGVSEFTQSKIACLRKELDLDDQQIIMIFFEKEVS